MNGGILLPQLSQHAGGLRRALLRSHSPMVCRLRGMLAAAWSRCAALLAFGVGEAGSRERRPSVAENSSSGRGTGSSGEAGVQGLLLHGSWRAPKLTVTNAPVFGHAAFWRGAVAETRF